MMLEQGNFIGDKIIPGKAGDGDKANQGFDLRHPGLFRLAKDRLECECAQVGLLDLLQNECRALQSCAIRGKGDLPEF